jgi:hypothetical protein
LLLSPARTPRGAELSYGRAQIDFVADGAALKLARLARAAKVQTGRDGVYNHVFVSRFKT